MLLIVNAGWPASNIVFGMGEGLLQKINRDTQRFAFKCSAQIQNGAWVPISKDPLETSKKSKPGKLKLVRQSDWSYSTVKEGKSILPDILIPVFRNGEIIQECSFLEIRKRSNE